jgi:signal transduction histidine kinase
MVFMGTKIEHLQPSDSFNGLESLHLRRLLEISTKLSSTLDIEQLLLMIVRAATELVDTEVASIMLLEEKTGELYFVAASDMANPVKVKIPKEASLAGHVVQTKHPFISNDVQQDVRHFSVVDEATRFSTRSMVGVPLLSKGAVIGVLEALNKRDDAPYSEEDVMILQALASQATVAIENARLFQQSDLLAEVMHELKTPLMALIASSELLKTGKLSREDNEAMVAMIHEESVRLSQMTMDFLDLARLESGRSHLKRERVYIVQLLEEVVELTLPQAKAREIEMEMNLPAFNPLIIGDTDRLRQVFINLINNAIKYNKNAGKIYLLANIENNNLHITIQDTGVGIPPDSLPQLFNRFYRVPDTAQTSDGSGLGLFVAHKIVEEHNGQINVTSTLGKGSTFTIVLPIAQNQNDTP